MTASARGRRIDTVFVIIIFCVFAVSVLMVLMLGASVYRNMIETSREGQDERVVLSYIWTKVKNTDDNENVYIGDFHGIPALSIDEKLGGTLYRTVIYHFNGWVYELFSEADLNFYPEDGIRITRLASLSFQELDNGLIQVSAGARNLLIFPRGRTPGLGASYGVFVSAAGPERLSYKGGSAI